MKRRDFLKTTGLVAGTLAGGLSVARGAQGKGDDLMKVALVGCGGRGRGAIMQRLEVGDNVKVVAICDAFEDAAYSTYEALDAMRDKYGDKIALTEKDVYSGFDSYKKAIDSCDQVLIATTPGFRPIHYRYAVDKGVHVFMEKPCCVDAPGYRSLMESNKIADQKGLSVVVGLQRHYQKVYNEFLKKHQEGLMGDLLYSRVYWNGDGIWEKPRLAGDTEMRYQMRNWYHFNWLSGDNLCEQHVHNLDIGNWIHGKGNPLMHPVKANGMGGRQVRAFPRYKDSGYRWDHYTVEFTYDDGTQMFSQCRHQAKTWTNVSEHFYGTKGYGDINRITERGTNKELWKFEGKDVDPYQEEHNVQVKEIREGVHRNDGWFGAVASMTACFGRMAAMSGEELTWDAAVAHGAPEFPLDDVCCWDQNPPVMPDTTAPIMPAAGELIYENSVAMPGIWKWSM